jgi:hypothetical protein
LQPRAGDIDIHSTATGDEPRTFQAPEHTMQTCKPYALILPLLGVLSLPAAAQGVNDGHDKEWRQLTDTVGATWNQLAAVCPRDGQTPCAGGVGTVDLTGWVWATDAQVLALFSYTEPAIIGNRSIGGMAYFGSAQAFLQSFTPTFSSCLTYACSAFAGGWTASSDAGGSIAGSASWGTTPVSISGGFGVGSVTDPAESVSWRGAFLFRPTGPGVFAYDDRGGVASPAGGTAVASVLANDWIHGARATPSTVSLRMVSSQDPHIALDASGAVTVASGAIVGTHSLVYAICDSSDATQCSSAVVTVTVPPYVIAAGNDAGTASPSVTSTAIASVLTNDTLGGVQATAASVATSLVSISPATTGIAFNPTDGSVRVSAGTALGTYALVYRICEIANPSNCAQATATVTVAPYAIDAVNDAASGSSKTGGTILASVLSNDRFNGGAVQSGQVVLSLVSIAPATSGITLNTTSGAVQVAPKTDSGSYTLTYRICDATDPANCDSATVAITLSGKSL